MLNNTINITDQKRILSLLLQHSGHDFRNYNSSVVKHRLDKAYTELKVSSIDDMCLNIEKYESFRDELLQILYIPTGEMLRDPSCWAEVKDTVLKKLRKLNEIHIWLPYCTTGEDLHSLRIILNEAELGYKSKILAYTPTEQHKRIINQAKYSSKLLTPLQKNLEITENSIAINRYFNYRQNDFSVNTKLFEDQLTIETGNYRNADFQSEFHLVIFRNRLIEFNKSTHFESLQILTNALEKSGYLVLGVNEQISKSLESKYKQVIKTEPIYKKIVY